MSGLALLANFEECKTGENVTQHQSISAGLIFIERRERRALWSCIHAVGTHGPIGFPPFKGSELN